MTILTWLLFVVLFFIRVTGLVSASVTTWHVILAFVIAVLASFWKAMLDIAGRQ